MNQAKLPGARVNGCARWLAAVSLLGVLGGCSGSVVEPPLGNGGVAGGTPQPTVAGTAGLAGAPGASGAPGAGAPGVGGSGGDEPMSYSVEECKRAGGIPVASIGSRQDPVKDCDSGVALGVIDAASSGWIEGGLCCAAGKDPLPPTGKACGARAGNTCSGSEYCAYVAGQYCGAADAEATCKPRPDACIELYAPVCGCDRKVYDNSCFASAAGTGVYQAGACD